MTVYYSGDSLIPSIGNLDGVMEPMNPLFSHVRLNGTGHIYTQSEPIFDYTNATFNGAGAMYPGREPVFDRQAPTYAESYPAFAAFSPMVRSDIETPTTLVSSAKTQFATPLLNGGGFGAVQDAISTLSFVDLLTRA